MKQKMSRLHWIGVAGAMAAAVMVAGCDSGPKERAGRPAVDPRDFVTSHMYPALQGTIGEYAMLLDSQPLSVEGYAVVAELPHTGSGDMPPSVKEILLDMLYKAGAGSYTRGTEDINPEKILDSDEVAAVEVRGAIPPLARRGDSFDLVVNCLPNSQATSLKDGIVWTCELKQIGLTADTHNDTRPIAMGRGPVFLPGPVDMITGDPAATQPVRVRRAVREGRVIGGGRVAEDRPIRLQLFNPSAPIAAAIERAINSRFPGRDKAAQAQSEAIISLNIPPEYSANPMEFIDVVKHMFLVQEQAGFTQNKARELITALKDPAAPAKDLSLALQSLGRSILPDFIQPQYTNPDPRVRYWCARAGAGLQDVGGMVVLQDFAKEPNSPYQKQAVEAVTDLSRGGDTDRATATLFDLLKSPNTADRIRAYEGLVAIHSPAVRTYSVGRKFWMDIVESDGPPLIFATQSGTPRIALIGPAIKLGAGLLYVSPDEALTVSVPEQDASADIGTGGSGGNTVLTASSGGTKAGVAAATEPAPKKNVVLYWKAPGDVRPPVEVKTSAKLPDIIARLAWIPDPRSPIDPGDVYIGVSYQRVTEMLASMCKQQMIQARFALENAPAESVRTPTDIINGARPEGSTKATIEAPAAKAETMPSVPAATTLPAGAAKE